MASPHVAGALALLASNPDNYAGLTGANKVYHLYDMVKSAGNYNWTDDSGDGVQEPLLDVSAFVPVLISVGGENTAPAVTISSPTNGATFISGTLINFSSSAADAEDGSLTGSLIWTSNLDGQIGTGGSFSSTTLGDGTHTIIASVTDSGGLTGSASVSITVLPVSQISLSVVRVYKVKTNKYADLAWSGAVSANVDVYRNGTLVTTTPNDGTYTDKPPKSVTSATYKVCEAGTSICSNDVTVSW
jgi:hypothetical protein